MNVHGPIPPTPPSVAAQIARLPELPIGELKALWKRLYEHEAPTHGRRFLEKRIAYRLQEIEFRKVNPKLLERNRQRIEALIEAGEKKKSERRRPANAGHRASLVSTRASSTGSRSPWMASTTSRSGSTRASR